MRFVTKWVWKRADALLYVDPSLESEATQAFGNPGRAEYVPTGYDAAFWTPGAAPKEDLAVTVGHAPTRDRWALKGIDLFLQVANANPAIEFHIVGELPLGTRTDRLGANVVADGWLDRESLRDLYRRAKVYCQFSLHEGLPNAVCEAMLCGCVPVGTRVNGIPTAIGDAGFVVDRSVPAIGDALRTALTDASLGTRARERIVRTFPIERRRDRLKEILETLAAGRDSP
jgi:glycosyltransferase involved in cell wall biosynthesis